MIGRQPNRLLISLTHTDGTFPPGLFRKGELAGIPWYYELTVTCLTPGARGAIATAVEQVQSGSYVWSIEVAEVDWGDGKAPWDNGVQLFAVTLQAPVGHQAGTIATAEIDAMVTRIKPSRPEEEPMLLQLLLSRQP